MPAGRIVTYDVVVPTLGRPSLSRTLEALAAAEGPLPGRVVLVDDRADRARPLVPGPLPELLAARVVEVRGRAAGPAAARNDGWRRCSAEWVAFLDDDVVPGPAWRAELVADLALLDAAVAGSQGRLRVPLPADRRPTDWERNVAGLETARWATADMAYRRAVLAEVNGFDERFPRAYREDADLALRVLEAGYLLVTGHRTSEHPVRPADRWVSVRLQRGNADDVLMARRHGRGWRTVAGVPRGRRPVHLATTAAAIATGAAALAGRPRVAAAAAVAWLGGTGELAWRRIAPGPRTADEIATMLATSAVIPAAASWHWVRARLARSRIAGPATACRARPAAILFDRDGTLVVDVPYNGDPDRVMLAPGAREALARVRAAGVPTGVVSNQSGVARGLLTPEQVDAVNRRIDELAGPFGGWFVCPHGPDDGCGCRKPNPGLILRAARHLGVDPARCVVIGDIGADVDAARAAGARAILVPTEVTRLEEIEAAPVVAPSLAAAVDLALSGHALWDRRDGDAADEHAEGAA